MKKIIANTLITCVLISGFASAADAEKVTEYRQGLFQVIAWNMGTLGAMAKGDMPYDAEKAKTAATRIDMVANMLPEAFVSGTYAGSNAKPEIETKPDAFKKHVDAFLAESKTMADAAGTEAGLKGQIGKLGGTCKSCHDDFRAD